jgi:ferredoxin-nitrate reductase
MAKTSPQDIDRWSKTYCPYCGVGCGLTVGVKDNRVVKIQGDPDHPSSQGQLCLKPIYLPDALRTDDRLLYPHLRLHQDAPFQRVTWDQAINTAAFKFRQIIDRHGPDAVAFYGSGQFSTEDYYTVNKLVKGFIGANNFDANSRLCMASAVVGYVTSLGSDGPPAAYEDIDLADCFFLIGANIAACHPVIFNRLKRRKKTHPETTIIVVDPRQTATAKLADIFLPIQPGTDVALLNAMLHVLLAENLFDQTFIEAHTTNFEVVRQTVEPYTPAVAARICGIPEASLVAAARAFGRAQGTLSLWSMGVNQSTAGVQKNQAILNLHLATGKIGRPGNGPFSLTGQPNAMGGREAGGLCHLLPGYRLVQNPDHRAEVAQFWGVPADRISPKPGLPAVQMFEAAAQGQVKALWIACTNPMVSMPNLDLVEAALRRAELVVVQDAYHPTDTTAYAHILLPAAQWSEKEGVMTNSERRITYLPKLVEPPGEALPDWQIFTRFARALGFSIAFPYESAAQVFAEFVQLTQGRLCDYSGVSHARLQREGPLQWPCPEPDHPGSVRLYTDQQFRTPDGKAKFHAVGHQDIVEPPDEDYPLVLTTGRVKDQWHTMTRTGKSRQLLKHDPEIFIEIHPTDAARWAIEPEQLVKVTSRRGVAIARARLTTDIKPGTCFMPFHWGRQGGYHQSANNLTTPAVDPLSKEPEFKACAVQVSPLLMLDLSSRMVLAEVEVV